jgi:hypothetical protein
MRIRSFVDPHHLDADRDSTYHTDADPDSDFYLMLPNEDPNPWKSSKIGSYSTFWHGHLLSDADADADPDPVPDPAYHFDTDPDPNFYLIRMWIPMRIQVTKMMPIRMRITIHNTGSGSYLSL